MFRKTKNQGAKTDAAAVSRAVNSGGRASPSIIANDLKLVGNVLTSGEIQFDGALEGELRAGQIIIGEHAVIDGMVAAESVVVRGAVTGALRARSVRLEATAKVRGDIHHEGLSIESGAFVDGRCIPCEDALEGIDLASGSDAHFSRSNDNAAEDSAPAANDESEDVRAANA